MKISIKQDDKVLVLGDFRVGKTYLCLWLLSMLKRWAAFDPGFRMGTIPAHLVAHNVADAMRIFDKYGQSVLRPKESDLEGVFEAWCTEVLKRSNLMAYIDEPSMVLKSAGTIPFGFSRLYRVGHARGIGVMMGTHRYHGDLPALTRIKDHLFCLRMSVDADLDALAEEIGPAAADYVAKQPDRFFYYKSSLGRQAFSPLPAPRAAPKKQEAQPRKAPEGQRTAEAINSGADLATPGGPK